MKTDSNILLKELLYIAKQDCQFAISLQNLTDANLNYKPAPNAWSILQCLEHLNLYAIFYMPEIEKALIKSQLPEKIFKGGFFGTMLVNMVRPAEKSKKMKTFKVMNPDEKILDRQVLNIFINNQSQLISLLERAAKANLNKRAVAVTFTSLIKLKTGDALKFMVYHHQRHIQQALRISYN